MKIVSFVMPSVIENGGNVYSINKIVSVTTLSNPIGCFQLLVQLSRLSVSLFRSICDKHNK